MGFLGALVDSATAVRLLPGGERVEGRTVRRAVESAPFRCRLDFNPMTDSPDAAVGAPEVIRSPMMMYALRDSDGDPVTLDASMRVHVTSLSIGIDEVFDVAGDPQPIRKKRAMIGWQVDLRHVTIPEAAA